MSAAFFLFFFLWGCTLAAAVLLLFEPQQATKHRWSLFCCWYVTWHLLSALKIEFRGSFSELFLSLCCCPKWHLRVASTMIYDSKTCHSSPFFCLFLIYFLRSRQILSRGSFDWCKDETSVNMSPQSCSGERFLFIFIFGKVFGCVTKRCAVGWCSKSCEM